MKAAMGAWTYFIVKMSMGEVAQNIDLSRSVYDDRTLDDAIQRVLDDSRVKKDLVKYLIRQTDRFYSSIVVAALKGEPKWYPVTMRDDERFALLQEDDRLNDTFGILSFDGSQKYYALDGQHRLASIKALLEDRDFSADAPTGFRDEEISVIVVVPRDVETEEEFRVRYRRLFGNLNRYAKPTDQVTNIIMDEDDAFAILTRRLISEHGFFQWSGAAADHPKVKTTKGKNLKSGQPFVIPLETLYEVNVTLLASSDRLSTGDWSGPGLKDFKKFRRPDKELDELFHELSMYWDALLDVLPDLQKDATEMRDHEAVEDSNMEDNGLFWPIVQELVAKLARRLLDSGGEAASSDLATAKSCLSPLSQISWELHQVPWRHLVLIPKSLEDGVGSKWKMRDETRKEALNVAFRIVQYMIGDTEYTEEFESSLRADWKDLLLPALPPDLMDEMWAEIQSAAE